MATRIQKQSYLPGAEPPDDPDIEEINQGLDAYLSAQGDQKQAGETTRIRHASLVQLISDHGLDRYPYIDPASGKKKHIVIARDPKLKSVPAPKKKQRREEPGESVEPKPKPTRAEKDAETVEHRKVNRADVVKELNLDPFAGVRAKLAEKQSILDDAAKAQDHATAAGGAVGEDQGGELVELPVGDKAKPR